jgi:ribosomal protein S18 acetylase RimI-like enzyme
MSKARSATKPDGGRGGDAARAVLYRRARRDDVPAIVRLFADDPLGAKRERYADPLPQVYWDAFEALERRGASELIVAGLEGEVVGTLQLDIIPGLSRGGTTRAQIEAVRVDARQRRARIGEGLMRHAIERARAHGCALVELTTDKKRRDAHRFYQRLGFVGSHIGMKMTLR